jgi:hypothetical protein
MKTVPQSAPAKGKQAKASGKARENGFDESLDVEVVVPFVRHESPDLGVLA